jgi:hypothetical protein
VVTNSSSRSQFTTIRSRTNVSEMQATEESRVRRRRFSINAKGFLASF